MSITATKLTTTGWNKTRAEFQVVGDKIYYVWYEDDGEWQIWTGYSNLDGTGFVATKQTITARDSQWPHLQVVGSTIYYVYYEFDPSNFCDQIWTATSNLDGTGWTPTKQTLTVTPFHNKWPNMQVVGSTIYYVWNQADGVQQQIWTATSNLDGTVFTPTRQTNTGFGKLVIELQVVGSKIYYTWYEHDNIVWFPVPLGHTQIWTATSNLDGTGWTSTKQTNTPFDKPGSHLQVVDTKIYYVWYEHDGIGVYQIWTAVANLDGTGFIPTQQTTTASDKIAPMFQVFGTSIYYAWIETDGVNNQIWSAISNLDGTNFTEEMQTTTAFTKMYVELQVDTIYHVWAELDAGGKRQLWMGTGVNFPTVSTLSATAVGSGVGTPNGTLDDDGGEACDCGFEWGETDAYGETTPPQSREIGQTFSYELSGLDPDTTYHFRAFATNSAGTGYGSDANFTTNPVSPSIVTPTVTTDEPTVAEEVSTIIGTLVNNGGEDCDCHLEWGGTTGYGNLIEIGTKTTGETFSQQISGLTPNTEYHYRAYAKNPVGTGYGVDRKFTTKQRPVVNFRPVENRSYVLSRWEL